MNILPKKRWHVRTKENIARVRKDEALAAEQAKVEQARIDKAESEARINFLRAESRKKSNADFKQEIEVKTKPCPSTSQTSKHINFFEELEQGNVDFKKSNKDYEKEKKEEQEKYEKQIGLLTYLGQGLQEATDKRWYNELPKRINDAEKNVEIKPNKKSLEDPVQDIKKYLNIIALKRKNNESLKSESLTPKHKESFEKFNKREPSATDLKEQSGSHERKKCKLRRDSSSDSERHTKKHKKQKKHKKSKKHKKDKQNNLEKLEKLRAERLKRELQEKLRAQELLKSQKVSDDLNSQSAFKQKYSSQFFPHLARQNCEKYSRS